MRSMFAGFLTGFMAAQVFLVLMLAFDIGALGSRIGAAANPLLPLGLMAGALGTLVGTAAGATATALPRNTGPLPDGHRTRPIPALRSVRAHATATIRRYWD